MIPWISTMVGENFEISPSEMAKIFMYKNFFLWKKIFLGWAQKNSHFSRFSRPKKIPDFSRFSRFSRVLRTLLVKHLCQVGLFGLPNKTQMGPLAQMIHMEFESFQSHYICHNNQPMKLFKLAIICRRKVFKHGLLKMELFWDTISGDTEDSPQIS